MMGELRTEWAYDGEAWRTFRDITAAAAWCREQNELHARDGMDALGVVEGPGDDTYTVMSGWDAEDHELFLSAVSA